MITKENDWTEEEWFYFFSLGSNPALNLVSDKWLKPEDMDNVEKGKIIEQLDKLYFERRNLLLEKEYHKGKRLPTRPPDWENYYMRYEQYVNQYILAQERVEKEFNKPSIN